jgi:hypothetical protein
VLGRPEPDLYVIDTIAPDESAIRRGAYFEQGDDLQGDIFNWWFDNWNQYRSRRRGSYGSAIGAKWDAPLAHLGDWHKHPGTLTEPSWGDTDTARHHIFDDSTGAPQLLAILATVWEREYAERVDPPETPEESYGHAKPLRIPVDAGNVVRIDCWYMSRLTRRFVRLTPQVMADRLLPTLPIVGWHLRQPERMRQEIDALSADGYAVSVEQYDVDELPPLEICLTLARRGGQHILIVVSEADYPASMPMLRVVPMSAMKDIPEGADLFVELWKKSEPVPKDAYPTWAWTPEHTMLDLVHGVEAKLPDKLPERNPTP